MNDKLHRVIGIDLGTTYSAVAAFNSFTDRAEIIKNRTEGDQDTTPSVIGVDPALGRVRVGIEAKRYLAVDPQNTVIEIKREMGEEFTPETLRKFAASDQFRPGEPVKIFFAGQWLLPQELSAFTLMKMKQIAIDEIGDSGPVIDAVITVPAYFTARQKKATEEAALLAGLYPRQLIPEPTAAAICYGLDRMDSDKHVYLVYDLGGGTFDVSIIEVAGEEIGVVATSGDPRLGGGDFDDALTSWVLESLTREYQLDLSDDPSAASRIKAHAENAKVLLSSVQETEIVLTDIAPQIAPRLRLKREKFEELIEDKLGKSLNYVDVAVELAARKGVERDDIDAILLVGGSSQIPKVKSLLLDYFGKDESFVRGELDPTAVVARGAAVLAYRFQPGKPPFDVRNKDQNTLLNPDMDEEDLKVNLITEHSLGIEVQDKKFSRVIEVGSNIPIEETKGGYTNGGQSTDLPVHIYQGEAEHVYDNTLIGTLHLGPIEPKPANYHQFEVTFRLDVNGLLSAQVHHLNTGKNWEATFEHKTGVGGTDALVAMHKKLVQMYGPLPAGAPLATPRGAVVPQGYGAPAPVVTPESTVAPPLGYQPAPPEGAAFPAGFQPAPPVSYQPAPPQGAAPGGQPTAGQPGPPGVQPSLAVDAPLSSAANAPGGPGSQPGTSVDTSAAMPDSAAAAGHTEMEHGTGAPAPPAIQSAVTPSNPMAPADTVGLVVPQLEVPPQFRQLVRRAQKLLLKQPDGALLTAFNTFSTALNTGAWEDGLIEFGDELADAFDDARQ